MIPRSTCINFPRSNLKPRICSRSIGDALIGNCQMRSSTEANRNSCPAITVGIIGVLRSCGRKPVRRKSRLRLFPCQPSAPRLQRVHPACLSRPSLILTPHSGYRSKRRHRSETCELSCPESGCRKPRSRPTTGARRRYAFVSQDHDHLKRQPTSRPLPAQGSHHAQRPDSVSG